VQDATAREYLVRLNESAKNLSDLFDRLRIVSEINSLDLRHELIDFGILFNMIKDRLKRLEGFYDIEFREEIEPTSIYCDSFLIETILTNMMENAIKFQKKSNEHKKIIETRIHNKEGLIVISFIDNGIGIRETDQKHLFQMFSNAALEHKNIGLGLYIVKQCVARLNGSIQLVHNENNFTEFEVRLPLS
jgi:signal transduction histidine kinase